MVHSFIEQMECTGIIPVIKLEDVNDAAQLARALRDGGIYCAEITYRAAGADIVISEMLKAFPDMLIGAGTVLTTENVDKAIRAGAKFCVAPGLNPKVVAHCLEKGVPFVPGVSSGSQIEQAMELGLDFVKFFPAEQSGGLPFIKAVSAPYSSMRFMPTGGVNENNLNSYLAFPKIVCCGGSWIAPEKLIKAKAWSEITQLCRSAVNKMIGYRLAHIGFNCANKNQAEEYASQMKNAFGFDYAEGNSSILAASGFEFMKEPFRGEKGHIAIGVNSIKRALFDLEHKGYKPVMSTAKYDSSGNIKAVYLEGELGGFALHLTLN